MSVIDLIPRLVRSSLEYDRKTTEATALMISKKLKKEHPEIASEITKALSYSGFENTGARSLDLPTLPVDRETRYSLVKVTEPTEILDPILEEYTRKQLDDFIKERGMIEEFLLEEIVPPNSLLLCGAPGVGKTYIAQWISNQLHLPMITLDLASSISSYLGRSGQNIQNVFEFAKKQNSILLLDELDAIAKKRDDSSDLGELKRLVNVLLKELETCPVSCVIIGATNHPELLDRAIWRRFDRVLNIPLPDDLERKLLIERHIGKVKDTVSERTLEYIATKTKGLSAADVCKLCEHIKRRVLLEPGFDVSVIALAEVFKVIRLETKEEKIMICVSLKKEFPNLTQREISQITQIPVTSVSRYLNKSK